MPKTACLVPRVPISKGTTALSGSWVQPVPEHRQRVRPETGDKSTYSWLLLTWKSDPTNPDNRGVHQTESNSYFLWRLSGSTSVAVRLSHGIA